MSDQPDFTQYRRRQIAELRPYVEGDGLPECVSISQADRDAGSPKTGDMIARNPANHDDQWLVAADYFAVNFEPVAISQAPAAGGGEMDEPVSNPYKFNNEIAWLREAARYFSARSTGGEDRAHWANVYNSENATKLADRLAALSSKVGE